MSLMGERSILYSPGHGAGWVSWEDDRKLKEFMISYQPIVDFVNDGGSFESYDLDIFSGGGVVKSRVEVLPDCLQSFISECQAVFGKVPYLSGLKTVKVMVVSCPVRIDDHDGYEFVEFGGGEWL